MGVLKFLPTRAKMKANEDHLVADLDALESEPVGFRFNGKIHTIRPIETGELLRVYDAFGGIDKLTKQKTLSGKEIIDAYVELFESVCHTIKRKDVEAMTQKQAAALFQLVFDAVIGRAQVEKKKT